MSAPRRPSLDELAAAPVDERDVAALAAAARLFERLDPVPPNLVERIQFGLTLQALHAEIAELQRSSGLVGTRADASDVTSITFTSANLTTMVTITPGLRDRVRIDGWISPGSAVAVELRMVGETLETVSDANGRFVLDDVPRGLGQFMLRPPTPGAQPVVTPSLEI